MMISGQDLFNVFIGVITAAAFGDTSALMLATSSGAATLELNSTIPTAIAESDKTAQRKSVLKVYASVNYDGVVSYGPLCTEEIRFGINQLAASNIPFFSKYTLQIEPIDDRCSPNIGTAINVKHLNDGSFQKEPFLPIVLLSPCPFMSKFAPILKYYHLNGLAMLALDPNAISNRRRFDGFYSVYDINDNIYFAVAKFIEMNGWRRIAVLSETDGYWIELEKRLAVELDRRNISLLGVAKVISLPVIGPDIASMESAVEELHWLDARVIIVHSSTPSLIACMLAKYNLYGPYYAILMNGLVYMDPLNSPRIQPWCTQRMVYDVTQSSVVFSVGVYTEYDPTTAVDAFNMTGVELERNLKTIIHKADQIALWNQARIICYEQMTTLGSILNITENALNLDENETLADWVTNSENFRKNPDFIYELIQKNIANIRYQALSRYLDFSVTGISATSQSLTPKFSQYRNITNSTRLRLVPLVKLDHLTKQLVADGNGKMHWLTKYGSPPTDSVRVIPLIKPGMPTEAAGVLAAFSILLIVLDSLAILLNGLAFARIFHLISVSKSVAPLRVPVLTGDILMNLFNVTSLVDCETALWFLLVGFSLILISHAGKLEISRNYVVFRNTLPLIVTSARLNLCMLQRTMVLVTGYTLLSAALVSCFVSVVAIRRTIFPLDSRILSQSTLAVTYQLWSDSCDYTFMSRLPLVEFSIAGLWLFLHCAVMLRCIFLTFILRNEKLSRCRDLGTTCSFVFSIICTILSGSAIAAILARRYEPSVSVVQMVIGTVVIICSIVNFTLTFLLKSKALFSRIVREIAQAIGQ